MMWAYLVVHSISAPAGPRVELTPSFFWQGGGISVSTESKATLIDSNVYQNKATNVCLLSEPFKTFLPSPQWYAHCWRCVVAGLREFCAESNPRV